jgi:hypothetical protein
MSNNNLWWAYNAEDNSFGALPASPLLVPALFIMGLWALFTGGGKQRILNYHEIAGHLADTTEWQQKYRRYEYLLQEQLNDPSNLDLIEQAEFSNLMRYLASPQTRGRR